MCASLLKWRLIDLTYMVVVRNKHSKIIYALLWVLWMRVPGQIHSIQYHISAQYKPKTYFYHRALLLIVLGKM